MGDFAGFVEDGVGEDVREMMLADHHLDIDSESVRIAEDLDDAAARGTIGGREVGDLYVDDDAFEIVEVEGFGCCGFFAKDAMGIRFWRVGGNLHSVGDDDRLGHPVVEGGDCVLGEALSVVGAAIPAGVALCVVKDADDGGVFPGEDANDAAEVAAVGSRLHELDEHLVALHGGADLVGRDEDVVI
jgi:hypothetical protein